MLKEIERFTAKEPDGKRHTVSCFQEFRKNSNRVAERSLVPGSKLFKTSDGIFLKAVDEFTFNILGSGKVLYRQEQQHQA